jgi:histidinol-phosphate phosphatase family protein
MESLGKRIGEGGWTIFLDRDGVINRRLPEDYVRTPEQFEFLPGVLEAFSIFNKLFVRIFIVTNQQGIGRGLMKESDLENVHNWMLAEIEKAGGRVDQIYFSPDLNNTGSFTRKPAVGMGLKARKDFPEIRMHQSIMAGDTFSDMLFGKRLNMVNVLITTDPMEIRVCSDFPNYVYSDLISFARELV